MGCRARARARRRGRGGRGRSAQTRGADFGDGPPEEDERFHGALPYARLHFFATAAMVANVLFALIIVLDGVATIADVGLPAVMTARSLTVAAVLALALAGAAGAQAPRLAAARASSRRAASSTAATAYACHGPNGNGRHARRRSAPARCACRRSSRGSGPSLRGVGALAADFYLRTGYMPLPRSAIQPRRSRVAPQRRRDPAR